MQHCSPEAMMICSLKHIVILAKQVNGTLQKIVIWEDHYLVPIQD